MDQNIHAWINAPFGCVVITLANGQLEIDLLSEAVSKQNQQSTEPIVMAAYAEITQYLLHANYQCNLRQSLQGTEFQCSVWQEILLIPAGETLSYGQIAAKLDSGPRAVANACGANKVPLIIPCHRVVAQNGIGGFMQGRANGGLIKQWLLQHEGVLDYA
jgi:methylated-DNA-[protein]-cysteine S-methyltransferase